jgi:hypothetical protein
MERFFFAILAAVLVSGLDKPVRADDTQATAVLDKAIHALGGEDRLGKIKAATWKAKGKITWGENGKGRIAPGEIEECDFTSQITAQGLDHFRSEIDLDFLDQVLKREGITKEEFEKELKQDGGKAGDFPGKLEILTALDGDKAWFTAWDYPGKLDPGHLKRTVYLELIPVLLAPVKGPGFKVEAAGEEKVGGRAAAVLKVTCPDGKDIKISFDKESGLPVKAVGKVFTLEDEEITQETTYGNYKDFGGIKIATRIEIKNGWLDRKHEVTEFRVLDKVDPSAFTAPKEADAVP